MACDFTKPFLCNYSGCSMQFTNEDHLSVHKKKHEMTLSFPCITNTSKVADQTPTPTRFIKHCEEVGLFQELQNVNPFEEQFKLAHESSKILPSFSDNTPSEVLKTPQIFPDILTPVDCSSQSVELDLDCSPNILTVTAAGSEMTIPSEEMNSVKLEGMPLTFVNCEKKNLFSLKVPQKLRSKSFTTLSCGTREKLRNALDKCGGTLEPTKHDATSKSRPLSDRDESNTETDVPDKKLHILERNRAAAVRCREKRKKWINNLKEENELLLASNLSLRNEVEALRNEVTCLKAFVLEHRNCSVTKSVIKQGPVKLDSLVGDPRASGNVGVVSSETSHATSCDNASTPLTKQSTSSRHEKSEKKNNMPLITPFYIISDVSANNQSSNNPTLLPSSQFILIKPLPDANKSKSLN